jgi:hypothetical protein
MTDLAHTNDAPIFMIHSSEMDFVTLVEHDYPPPIAFKDRQSLQTWMDEHKLVADPIGRRDEDNKVAMVQGRITPWGFPEGLSYRQVWASVNYTRYRDAMKFQVKSSEGSLKTVDLYDADHAVGQTRLSKLWPEAWVNMVLVESAINRAIGAMMEKAPLEVEPDSDQVMLNTESMLKTFLKRDGALQQTGLREYLEEVRKRFIKVRGNLIISDSGSLDSLGLHTHLMSNNTTVFFDHLAREHDVPLLD